MAMAMAMGPTGGRFLAPNAASRRSRGMPSVLQNKNNKGFGFNRSMQNEARFIPFSPCKSAAEDKIEDSRKYQLLATEVLAELLKSPDKDKRAEELVDSLNEEFFYIASTYLAMAKKEANVEVVNHVEVALKAAMVAKDKTLRPEIRLFNQLLRNNSSSERQQTIQENHQYLHEKSYFFELLEKMMKDVEAQKDTPDRAKLMNQLRIISKQTKDVAKMIKRTAKQS